MRNILALTTLALTAILSTTHASPSPFPLPTPPPNTLNKRQSNDEVSSALASATSALAEHPSSASSILSELRENYGTILDEATGCESSRWARITGSIGDFDLDDGLGDGVGDLLDGVFSDDDDECEDRDDDDDDDDDDDGGLFDDDDDEENAAGRSKSVAWFGAVGMGMLVGAALV